MSEHTCKWIIRKSGGRLGWPEFIVNAERKRRGDPRTFTCVSIEDKDFDGYEGAHIALALPQARRLLEILPDAIAFAEGKRR